MNLTSFFLLAQTATDASAQPSLFSGPIVPMTLVFVIFYFLMLRPQQKKAKEHAKLVAGVKTGDHVVTSSGIHGIIANVKDRTVIVKVADNVKIEFDRASITTVEKSPELVVEEVKA